MKRIYLSAVLIVLCTVWAFGQATEADSLNRTNLQPIRVTGGISVLGLDGITTPMINVRFLETKTVYLSATVHSLLTFSYSGELALGLKNRYNPNPGWSVEAGAKRITYTPFDSETRGSIYRPVFALKWQKLGEFAYFRFYLQPTLKFVGEPYIFDDPFLGGIERVVMFYMTTGVGATIGFTFTDLFQKGNLLDSVL